LKHWIYHKVPENLFGNTIYPLNQLKTIRPDLYESQIRKYRGREGLLSRYVPSLDCLWNDVVFLCAVDPVLINAAIESVGLLSPKDFGACHYFKIDLDVLDRSLLTTFLHAADDQLIFSSFDVDKMSEYALIPEAQHEYYREKRQTMKPRYLVHSRVVHILYKGRIDISDTTIITL
jgi:hypothetical protein